jgi:hypothetical protein
MLRLRIFTPNLYLRVSRAISNMVTCAQCTILLSLRETPARNLHLRENRLTRFRTRREDRNDEARKYTKYIVAIIAAKHKIVTII